MACADFGVKPILLTVGGFMDKICTCRTYQTQERQDGWKCNFKICWKSGLCYVGAVEVCGDNEHVLFFFLDGAICLSAGHQL